MILNNVDLQKSDEKCRLGLLVGKHLRANFLNLFTAKEKEEEEKLIYKRLSEQQP